MPIPLSQYDIRTTIPLTRTPSFAPLIPPGMRSAIPLDTADSLVGAMPVRKMPFSAQLLKQPKVIFDLIGKNLDDFAIPGNHI